MTATEETTVGCRAVEVTDGVQGARVPLWILYPARAPERIERFGAYAIPLAMNAPFDEAPGRLPLVLVSHGTGSTPWVFRDLARHLAQAGFAVALIEHPGNSRNDNSLAGTAANLANRPRHVRLALDAAFTDAELAARLAPAAEAGVALIGHSLGGYTALAAAGGRPACFPNESPDGQAHGIPVVRDDRVRALVLLAPATPWLMSPGALAEVELPVLILTGERDEHAPPFFAQIVENGVPERRRVHHRVVPGAGHFSFFSPFPPEMTRPDFPPSQDPPGFDRAAFQPILFAEILTFLRAPRASRT